MATEKLSAEQLRAQLNSDPRKFEELLDRLIASCTDPDTIRFWKAMKEFARRSSNG